MNIKIKNVQTRFIVSVHWILSVFIRLHTYTYIYIRFNPPQFVYSTEVGGFAGSNNPMLNDNIPRIIRWFKGRCTFEIRKIDTSFKWQTRYYDRIIRNDQEYERIKFYIENNVNT